jgi:hypothetical protein
MEAFTHVEIRAARADISLSGHMPRPIGFGAGWARVATGGRIRAHGLWADRIVSLASPIEISVLGGYTASLGLSSEAGRIVVENRTAFGFTATTDTGTVELRGAIYDGHVSITGPGHLIANPSVEPVGDFRLGQSFDAQLAPGASVDAPGRPRTVEGAQRLVFQGPKGDARWNACHSLMVIR